MEAAPSSPEPPLEIRPHWEAARGQDQGISQGEGCKAPGSQSREQGWGREEVLAPRGECSCEGRGGRGARQSLPRPARSRLVSSLTPHRSPLHGWGILPTKWSEPGEAPCASGRQRPPVPGLPGPSPWALPSPCLCNKTEPLRAPACRLPLSGQGLSHLLFPVSQEAGWAFQIGRAHV